MDFVENWYLEYAKRKVTVNYITDCLRYIVSNTAEREERYTVDVSLRDILDPKEVEYTAEDVIENIKQKLSKLGA